MNRTEMKFEAMRDQAFGHVRPHVPLIRKIADEGLDLSVRGEAEAVMAMACIVHPYLRNPHISGADRYAAIRSFHEQVYLISEGQHAAFDCDLIRQMARLFTSELTERSD